MKSLRLMLACNNEIGDADVLRQVELDSPDRALEPLLKLECMGDAEPIVRFEREGRVRIGRRVFPYLGHRSMVGNVFWDAITVKPAVAAELLTWLLRQTIGPQRDFKFDVTEGEIHLCELVEAERAVRVDDLARAVVGGRA